MPQHPTPSLSLALRSAAMRLRAAGIDSPEADARILAAHALRFTPLEMIARQDHMPTPDQAEALDALIARRINREPVSRILGCREFYGRKFAIAPATLDPRPDTETLIELALEIVGEQGWRTRPIRIIDVGTGSGCILLTLLAELPLATGVGTDIDPEALDVASRNAAQLGLETRVRFEVAPSLAGCAETFDLLVSNPPYIPSGEIPALDPEVRDYDPYAALDGGADGLAVYREIARDLQVVVPRGWAIFEVGAGQADAVLATVSGPHISATRQRLDLGGHRRAVAAWTQC